jgi:hypothetical protein
MGTVHRLALAKSEGGEATIAPRRRVLMRAEMRIRGKDVSYPVTVRDISSTGLRASASVNVFAGTIIEVQLPNLGWIPGEVVRTGEDRDIGVQFGMVIEPEHTQTRVTGSYGPAPSGASGPALRRV